MMSTKIKRGEKVVLPHDIKVVLPQTDRMVSGVTVWNRTEKAFYAKVTKNNDDSIIIEIRTQP